MMDTVVSLGAVVSENCAARKLVWSIEGVVNADCDNGKLGEAKVVTRGSENSLDGVATGCGLHLFIESIRIFSVSKKRFCVLFQMSLSLKLNI